MEKETEVRNLRKLYQQDPDLSFKMIQSSQTFSGDRSKEYSSMVLSIVTNDDGDVHDESQIESERGEVCVWSEGTLWFCAPTPINRHCHRLFAANSNHYNDFLRKKNR